MAIGDYLTGVGLGQLFDESGFIEVTGLSTRGTDAVSAARSETPDIVLIDALISDHGMAETTAAISQAAIRPKIVILSGGGASGAMESAFQAGACSYLERGTMLEDVAAALRIVHRGGLVSPAPSGSPHQPGQQAVLSEYQLARYQALNDRDAAIVEAVSDGYTNSQISRQLHLSEATVKARLTQLMQQLGAENRVQIAVAAVHAGLHLPERGRITAGASA